MSGGLVAVTVATHAPRLGIEEKVKPFQLGLIRGLKEMGDVVRGLGPDLIVLMSAHWVSTFNWYVTRQAFHHGHAVADEAPDLLPGQPYYYRGDPAFADALIEAMTARGVPTQANDSEHFSWDYASYVPLHYMDPNATIPVVLLPTVICGSHEESIKVGQAIEEAAIRTGKRVVFIASNALSHAVTRGPENWPTAERVALDKQLIAHLEKGEVDTMLAWLPTFTREAVAEMGGKVLATMFGAAKAMETRIGPLKGVQYGDYAQSSGSGNANIALTPV